MGIEDFKVVQDNRGGRPTKEEQEDSHRGISQVGDPFYPEKDTKQYWQNLIDRFVAGTTPDADEVASICDHTHLFPWDVKMYLEKHGICSFEWMQMPDDYPPDTYLKFLLEDAGVENDFTNRVASVDSGKELTGGWAEIINDAKGS